jgi:hypothetical protein
MTGISLGSKEYEEMRGMFKRAEVSGKDWIALEDYFNE